MTHQGQPPAAEHEQRGSFVEVQRSMRVGPLAAGAGLGAIIVAVVATALFGLPPGPAASVATATVATPTSASPAVSTARPSPATSSSLATLVPNSPLPIFSATPTPTERPQDTPTSGTPMQTSSTPGTTTPYPDVQGYQECARSGAGPYAAVGTANESTSCGFAVNVWKAYLAAGINGGAGTVTASSPATGKTYQVACSGDQPARCSGGVNGRVLIYGGRLV